MMVAIVLCMVFAIGVSLNSKALGPSLVGAVGLLLAGTDESKMYILAGGWVLAYILSAFRE